MIASILVEGLMVIMGIWILLFVVREFQSSISRRRLLGLQLCGALLILCNLLLLGLRLFAGRLDSHSDFESLPRTPQSDRTPTVVSGDVDPDIRRLFDAYAKTLNDHQLSTSLAFFFSNFFVGMPQGTDLATNDAARRAVIALEDAYYKNTLGMTSARIVFIEQTSLGGHHVFVRTRWGCTFAKTGERVIEFPLSFVVDRTGRDPKIITHIVEADEPRMFRDLGLIRE